jgi:hypothetical protein
MLLLVRVLFLEVTSATSHWSSSGVVVVVTVAGDRYFFDFLRI